MSFPNSLDEFLVQNPNEIIAASVINRYQKSIIACQSELTSLVNRNVEPSKKMVGFCWKVQISLTTYQDVEGYGQYKGWAENSDIPYSWDAWSIDNKKDIFYRYKKRREPYVVDNRQQSTLGSYTPYYSFATLPLPNGITYPNNQPFHANNTHFVTFESAQENVTVHDIPNGRNPWSARFPNSGSSNEKMVGGFSAREGMLYYNGQSDKNPKVVISDWCPSIDEWDNDENKRGELITVLVHMVIIG